MKQYILHHYLHIATDSIVIGHRSSRQLENFLLSLAFSIGIRLISIVLHYFWPDNILFVRILAILMVVIYLRFLVLFINQYLNSMIIDKDGITVITREYLFNYSIQVYHRDSIVSIVSTQARRTNKLRKTGDIHITLTNDEVIIFRSVYNPNNIAQLIGQEQNTADDEVLENSQEKFDILVETLGEVIKDYMGKKSQTSDTSSRQSTKQRPL